jgi:flavin reductase (DIM6/NTAB) family NADH-FMN oxidoreductase RutF
MDAGDHVIVGDRVFDVHVADSDSPPLLFFRSDYPSLLPRS